MKTALHLLLAAGAILVSGCLGSSQPVSSETSSLTTDAPRSVSEGAAIEAAEHAAAMGEVATIAAASEQSDNREASASLAPAPESAAGVETPSPVAADAETLAALEPGAQPEPKGSGDKPASDANPTARPKADRTPRKAGDPIRITFDNLIIGMQADIVFRDWMLKEDVKELEGQRVSITGVMHGAQATKKTDYFVLLRNKECKYGKGGQADHLTEVNLSPNTKTTFTTATVRVDGVLRIEPKTGTDGNTWSLYILDDAKVTVQ